jgi:hypothetical protein
MTTNLPNGHKLYHMAMKYARWPQNIPTLSIPRPSKIYSNLIFGMKIHLAILLYIGQYLNTIVNLIINIKA